MNTPSNKIRIRPYNLTELGHLYGVNARTIKRWIKPHMEAIGNKEGRFFTPRQVKTIFDKICFPIDVDIQ